MADEDEEATRNRGGSGALPAAIAGFFSLDKDQGNELVNELHDTEDMDGDANNNDNGDDNDNIGNLEDDINNNNDGNESSGDQPLPPQLHDQQSVVTQPDAEIDQRASQMMIENLDQVINEQEMNGDNNDDNNNDIDLDNLDNANTNDTTTNNNNNNNNNMNGDNGTVGIGIALDDNTHGHRTNASFTGAPTVSYSIDATNDEKNNSNLNDELNNLANIDDLDNLDNINNTSITMDNASVIENDDDGVLVDSVSVKSDTDFVPNDDPIGIGLDLDLNANNNNNNSNNVLSNNISNASGGGDKSDDDDEDEAGQDDQMVQLTAIMNRYEGEKQQLLAQYQEIEAELRDALHDTENENVILQDKLQEQTHLAQQLNDQLEYNQQRMSEMSAEYTTYQEDNGKLKQHLDQLETDHAALQHNYEELQEAYEHIQEQKYDDKLKELQNQVTNLTGKNGELKENNDKLNEKLEQFTGKLAEVNEAYNQTVGALEASQKQLEVAEAKNAELMNDRLPHMQAELTELQQNYDMLLSYSSEQAQVIDQLASLAPKDEVLEEQFEQIRTKRSLIINGAGQRSVANSLGGLQEFYSHLGKLSNVSDLLRKNSVRAEELKYDSADDTSSVSTRTSDVTSIASNETRYSFLPYHTHDAMKEFFFLTALCVKLNLCDKYGISPDIAPDNQSLWKQCLSNGIVFHQWYEYLYNELTNLYEYKYKTKQGLLRKVVITDTIKVRAINARENPNKTLHPSAAYGLTPYHRTLGGNVATMQVSNEITPRIGLPGPNGGGGGGGGASGNRIGHYAGQRSIDRTMFTTNDIFGGKINITTREKREQNKRRLSRSSQGSYRSHRSSKDNDNDNRNRQQGKGGGGGLLGHNNNNNMNDNSSQDKSPRDNHRSSHRHSRQNSSSHRHGGGGGGHSRQHSRQHSKSGGSGGNHRRQSSKSHGKHGQHSRKSSKHGMNGHNRKHSRSSSNQLKNKVESQHAKKGSINLNDDNEANDNPLQ